LPTTAKVRAARVSRETTVGRLSDVRSLQPVTRLTAQQLAHNKARIYNDVGAVKEKTRDTSPEDAERPVKGARRAFISTLDRTFRVNTIENRNEAKRSSVELRSLAEFF
jgi:hypothetical protein